MEMLKTRIAVAKKLEKDLNKKRVLAAHVPLIASFVGDDERKIPFVLKAVERGGTEELERLLSPRQKRARRSRKDGGNGASRVRTPWCYAEAVEWRPQSISRGRSLHALRPFCAARNMLAAANHAYHGYRAAVPEGMLRAVDKTHVGHMQILIDHP
jgi:hypothetical protein